MKILINGKVFDGRRFINNTSVFVEGDRIIRLAGGPDSVASREGLSGQDGVSVGDSTAGPYSAAGSDPSGEDFPEAEVIDLKGDYLVPGFIDLHVMGGSGVYFSNEPTAEAIERIAGSHLKYGVTSWLPTLISAPPETIFKAISATREAMKRATGNVLGMHLEGPFLHPEKRGAHREALLRKPDDALLDEIIAEGRDVIRVITIAPEFFSPGQLNRLLDSGMQVAVAHSMVTCNDALGYFDQGIGLVTHLYNAMRQFNSREPGLVGAAFEHPSVKAAIIADGVHVDFRAVRTAHRLLKDRLYLVSDCTFIDYPVDHFEFEGVTVYNRDGKFVNEEGNLAGSAITVWHAVKNCVEHGICSLEEALAKVTSIPAEIAGLQQESDLIAEGARANLLVLDKDLAVKQRWLNGVRVMLAGA